MVGEERAVAITGPRPFPVTREELLATEPGSGSWGPESVVESLLSRLRQDTLTMAMRPGRITAARCATDSIKRAPTAPLRCTTTFDDLTVEWRVLLDSGYRWTGSFIEYRPYPAQRILSDAIVYDTFWDNFRDNSDRLRCDALPEIWLAETDKETGYRCQFLGRPDRGVRTWTDVPISVDNDGRLVIGSLS